jgi:hypothetical protein
MKFNLTKDSNKQLNDASKNKDYTAYLVLGKKANLVLVKDSSYIKLPLDIDFQGDGVIQLDLKQLIAIMKNREDVYFSVSGNSLKFTDNDKYKGILTLNQTNVSKESLLAFFQSNRGVAVSSKLIYDLQLVLKYGKINDIFQKSEMLRYIQVTEDSITLFSGDNYHLTSVTYDIKSDVELKFAVPDNYLSMLDTVDCTIGTSNSIFYVKTENKEILLPLYQVDRLNS